MKTIKFPTNERNKEKVAERDKRLKEAEERVDRGQATDEDIDLFVDQFLTLIEALEEGKVEFLEQPQ